MSLATPPKLRRLQEALDTKAKQEPAYRFYLLYDKVYRRDILAHAYALSKQKGGAPGVDGVTCADIEAAGVEPWLAAVQEALRTETYRPQPVRRVLIPKPGGTGERPLGIPVIQDRVVQTAALLILQPIFEADLEPTAYGYRPGRTAWQAVQEVHRALCAGHAEVMDADLSSYFDAIPHADLMKSLARRLSDRRLLRLLKRWLKAPVAERTDDGGWRFSGGKRNTRGTPPGGVLVADPPGPAPPAPRVRLEAHDLCGAGPAGRNGHPLHHPAPPFPAAPERDRAAAPLGVAGRGTGHPDAQVPDPPRL